MIRMTGEEVRLRSLLTLRTGDVRYVMDIPKELSFCGLYPERMRSFKIKEDGKVEYGPDPDEQELKKLKEKLDIELGIK
jgi:hypothetical protein